MFELYPLIFALLAIIIGPILLFLSLRWLWARDTMADRLTEVISEANHAPRRPSQRTRQFTVPTRTITGSITSRVLMPSVRWLGRTLGKYTPARVISDLDRKLVTAGNPMGLTAREFYAVQLAFITFGAWLAFVFISRGTDRTNLLTAVASVFVCYAIPRTWLQSKVRNRQNLIRKGIPDVMDMLSVCTTAGLGFDQAIQRVSDHWRTPVGLEFGRVIAEMEMGISRRDALRNFANRVDISEASTFVSFILQSEQLGLSIADTLHTLADQMRIERRLKAQEQAQKVPIKMLLPMAFLIFPAIMAVILGPIVPGMMQFFERFPGGF